MLTFRSELNPLDHIYKITFQFDRECLPRACIAMASATPITLGCALLDMGSPGAGLVPEQDGTPLLSICCTELAVAYYKKYLHSGDRNNVALHLSYATLGLGLSSDSRKDKALALGAIGLALVTRFRQAREISVIDCAVAAYRHALLLGLYHFPELKVLSIDLAVALHERHIIFGGSEDLAEAIKLLEEAYFYARQSTTVLHTPFSSLLDVFTHKHVLLITRRTCKMR